MVCGCKRFLAGIATGGGGVALGLVIFMDTPLLVLWPKLSKDLVEPLTLFGALLLSSLDTSWAPAISSYSS